MRRSCCLSELSILFLLLLMAITIRPSVAQRSHADVKLYPVPTEVSSRHFVVTIQGKHTPVQHAASGYYILNFDVSGPAFVEGQVR